MNAQIPNQSVAISMMISRAAYQVVVGVEMIAHFISRMLGSAK